MDQNRSRELYQALKRLNRLMHRHGHHDAGRHGLHRGQLYLLKAVQQNDGVVQRDLADIIDIRPSSLTELLLRMEQAGLIERRQDERDQRLMHIHLTPAGREALERAAEVEGEADDSLFHSLTDGEGAALLAICGKLCEHLENVDGTEGHHHHHHHHDCDHHDHEHHGHDCHHGDGEHHGHKHHGCDEHEEHHGHERHHDHDGCDACRGHDEHHEHEEHHEHHGHEGHHHCHREGRRGGLKG